MMYKDGFEMAKCPGRFQFMFLRVCAVTLLVSLVFYTFTITRVNENSDIRSWNISRFLHSAANKFQSVMKLPEGPKSHYRKTKMVLLWTDYFSKHGVWVPTTRDLQCPVTECNATANRDDLDNSSAIVFHWRSINTSDLPQCSKTDTGRCPLWILVNKEAPPHTHRDSLEIMEKWVHWTVSYRRDSDIFAPYGRIETRKSSNYSKPEFDPNKHLVCWLVSNCDTPSKREVFVDELENYIRVDKYGGCGTMRCPHELTKDCYHWLSDKCLFYLSLENSICKEYTTEKLYYAMSNNMVPVVMGPSDNYKHLPPHSYINANDFSSPKELAEYLVKVGKDRELYESYLAWKRKYEVVDTTFKWFCDLCKKLHETDTRDLKPRGNLVNWWYNESECTVGPRFQ